jgi:hypothetical protein
VDPDCLQVVASRGQAPQRIPEATASFLVATVNVQSSNQPLYVTFHDQPGVAQRASSLQSKPSANVYVIDANGIVAEDVLDTPPEPYKLDELRALVFGPDQRLWVVSAAKDKSAILRYTASMDENHKHRFCDAVNCDKWCPSLIHPFDLAFIPPGTQPVKPAWFVSNQDTNVVVGPLQGAPSPPTPPVPKYLQTAYPGVMFCPGTFVASAVTPTPADCGQSKAVPIPQGLDGVFSNSRHSVRGLAHDGKRLYVADEWGNKIKGYDRDGKLAWMFPADDKTTVVRPVHLLLDATYRFLYIGSSGEGTKAANGAIVRVNLQGEPDPVKVVSGVLQLSGMAIAHDGTLYYASRGDMCIYRAPKTQYGPKFTRSPPEFITCPPSP